MQTAQSAPENKTTSDNGLLNLAIILLLLVTFIPYLWGASLANGRWYSWLGYNLDDSCVYLSWMRQAADGHFFLRHMFSTSPDASRSHQFNLLFWTLGAIAGQLHLPLIFVLHAARFIFGFIFLRTLFWFISLCISDRRTRWAAFGITALSAGLGWVPGLWHHSGINSPVDVWQPEAITLLSLSLSPLFIVALTLMLGILGCLLKAEREQRLEPALLAGFLALLLGNIHSYDAITLGSIWITYLIIGTILRRPTVGFAWLQALLAAAIGLPSVVYEYLQFKNDPLFHNRAEVATLSPQIQLYLLGYGLVLLLAIAGWWELSHRSLIREERLPDRLATHLLIVWAVVGLMVPYLPFSFQRKLLMGEHIPLSILAGIAITPRLSRLPGHFKTIGWVAVLAILSLTNWRFMRRDMQNDVINLSQTMQQRPYMNAGEYAALRWIRLHTPANAAIQPLPWIYLSSDGRVAPIDMTLACFAPEITDHSVYCGHWGETPDYTKKLGLLVHFMLSQTSNSQRIRFLKAMRVQYLIFSQVHPAVYKYDILTMDDLQDFLRSIKPLVRLVYSNSDAQIYQVKVSKSSPH